MMLISVNFKNNIYGIMFGNQFQKPNIDEIEFIEQKIIFYLIELIIDCIY